jgi:tol-pal system protein YbgF
MTKTGPAKAGFAIAIVAAAAFVPISGANAEWWNPFKQRPDQAEPLPPPPAAPSPPADIGSPSGGPTNLAPGSTNQPPASFGNPEAITSPPRAGDPVALNPAIDATTRMDRLESSLRQLTGQLEQVTFEIGKLRDELTKLREDSDYRFQSLEDADRPPQQRSESTTGSGPDFGSAEPHPDGQDTAMTEPKEDSETLGPPSEPDAIAAAIAGTQLGAPPRALGTLTLDGSQPGGGNVVASTVAPPAASGEQPLSLSQLTGGPEPVPAPDPSAGVAPVAPGQGTSVASIAPIQAAGTPTEVYDRAYQFVLDGDYEKAEQSFRSFLVTFPTDKRAPDAQYWIGDSLFQRGMYREAGQEFNSGYRAYPKSGKAPDSLLRLGMSLTALGQREAACAVYSELVKRYPDAPHALLQKVKAEQASGTC